MSKYNEKGSFKMLPYGHKTWLKSTLVLKCFFWFSEKKKLLNWREIETIFRGMARTFQSKGGWVTLCQNESTYQNTMLFLSPVVGCLLKKKL